MKNIRTYYEPYFHNEIFDIKLASYTVSNDTQKDNMSQSSKTFEYDSIPLHIIWQWAYNNCFSTDKKENIDFRDMQNKIIEVHTPVLYSVLRESEYEMGYESKAERYFNELYKKYEATADLILQNIFWENRKSNIHIIKEILFIIAELPKERRKNLYYIAVTGLDNEDDEVKDLSIRCFEVWNEKDKVDILKNHAFSTEWLEQYRISVILDLESNGEM